MVSAISNQVFACKISRKKKIKKKKFFRHRDLIQNTKLKKYLKNFI
jgi:hypothetical protein